jgi:ABC-type transport system substrate-binding protein
MVHLSLLTTFLIATNAFSAAFDSAVVPRGVYVKAMFSRPLQFDPAKMDDGPSLVFSNLVYDGLLAFTPELGIRPALAESWQVEQGGKLLVFRLRQDAKFQDGSPVTAQDVVASLRRLVRRDSRVSSYYNCIVGAEDYFQGKSTTVPGLRARGAHIVEIELTDAFPPFLSVLAGATAKVLPAWADEDPKFFSKPVGSGPFRYVGSTRSSDLVLEPFSDYYDGSPKLRKLILRQMNGEHALEQAELRRVGDLADYYLNGDEKAFRGGQHLRGPVAATWIIGLNLRRAPFDKIEIRKAFIAAIDPDEFRKRFFSSAITARGYIPPGFPGFRWSYRAPAQSRDLSAETLRALPKIRLVIPRDIPRSAEIAKYLGERLTQRGFNVETALEGWDDLMKGYTAKSHQAFLVSMNIDYPDTEFLVRNFESTNPDNFSGLNDRHVDSLIRKARATPDKALRQKLYVELAERLNDAAVTVNLLYPEGHFWVHPCVRGFKFNPLGDPYVEYAKISIDPDCRGGQPGEEP